MRNLLAVFIVFWGVLEGHSQTWPFDPEPIPLTETTAGLSSLELCDFDRDGDLDIFFTSLADNELGYFENHKGEYGKKTVCYTADNALDDLMIADFDQDGYPELAAIKRDRNFQLLVFELDTLGKTRLVHSVDWNYLQNCHATDVDGDGKADIVGTLGGRSGAWAKNLGNYTFENPTIFTRVMGVSSGLRTQHFDFIDIDKDGDQDFLTVEMGQKSGDYRVVLYENDSASKSFNENVIKGSNGLGVYCTFLDFDGDSIQDFVLHGRDSLHFYQNIGNYGFEHFSSCPLPYEFKYSSAAHKRMKMNPIDFDQDGDMDFLLKNNGDYPSLYLVENTSSGIFQAVPESLITFNRYTTNLASFPATVGDVNQDSFPDIITGAQTHNAVYLLQNPGKNPDKIWNRDQITETSVVTYPESGGYIIQLGDSLPDFVLRSPSDDFEFYKNVGDLTFTRLISLRNDVGLVLRGVGDLNGNGFDDLIFTSTVLTKSTGSNVRLYWNDGNGSYNLDTITPGSKIIQVVSAVEDINNDGYDDILQKIGDTLFLFEFSSSNKFFERKIVTFFSGHAKFKIADFNNDKWLDIIVVDQKNGPMLSWYENQRNYTFKKHDLSFSDFTLENNYKAADYDDDGLIDIVGTKSDISADSLTFRWYRNMGGGQFSSGIPTLLDAEISTSSKAYSISLVDLNSDSKKDFLLTSGSLKNWYEKINPATASNSQEWTMYNTLHVQWLVDLDMDGDPEIVCRNFDESNLYILKNISDQPSAEAVCFYDINENGIQDSSERILSFIKCNLMTGGETRTASRRQIFSLGDKEYMLEVDSVSMEGWSLTTDSSGYAISGSTSKGLKKYYFGFFPKDTFRKVTTWIHKTQSICNIQALMQVGVQNTGTLIADGELAVQIDPDIDSNSISANPDTSYNHTYFYTFKDLYPGETKKVYLKVRTPGIPFVPLGHSLNFEAYSSVNNSRDTSRSHYESRVFCSYDPNDISVSPDRVGDKNDTRYDEVLHYRIRFQNTGNFPATKVEVTDELDSNLDLSSLKILGSSHPGQLEHRIIANKAFFTFDGIYLPDSTTDFLGSQGFIIFSIRTKPKTPEGTEIRNLAKIYFDQNPAIITNEVLTTIVPILNFDHLDVVNLESCNSLFFKNQEYLASTQVYDSIILPQPHFYTVDTVYVYNITIDSVYHTANYDTLDYPGSSFVLPSGAEARHAGMFIDSFVVDKGCDSIVTTYLVYNPETYGDGEWTFYPSPADGEIKVKLKDVGGEYELVVMDPQARIVHKSRLENGFGLINVAQWSPGVYLVQLKRIDSPDTKLSIKRVIVNHSIRP